MSNLLPSKEKKVLRRIRTLRYIRAYSYLFLIAGIAALLLLIPTSHAISTHYAVAQQALARYGTEGSLVSDASINSLTHALASVASKLGATLPPTPVDLMLRLEPLIPASVHVAQFAVNDIKIPVITLSGTAATRTALQSFVDALSATKGIAHVVSPVENYVKSTNLSFTISVTFAS
jgi:hypothetical protein